MKLNKIIYGMASLLLMGLAGCSDNFSEPPVPTPEGGTVGTGAWDNPMTAYQARIGSINSELGTEVWVRGVIVGYVDTEVSNTLSAASAWIPEMDAERAEGATVYTNLLIATSKEVLENVAPEDRWQYCASVQLPSGSVRNALSIKDHPDNLWKEVCIYGTTGQKYCGVYGVRSVTDYNWGPVGKEPVEVKPVEPSGAFYQDFDKYAKFDDYAALGWKNVATAGGLSGWYIKEYSGNNYITVSAYLGSASGGPYENWLITPPIDMAKLDVKTLEFITQAAYQAPDCGLEVYALDSDNPATAQKTLLNAKIATPPASGYSSWENSGKIDLSGLSGTIYIGWRYYSAKGGADNSTTYGIDNVNVGNASTSGDTPGGETPGGETPGGDTIYSGLAEGASAIDWVFENVTLPSGVSYVWQWKEYNGKHYLNGSAYKDKAAESEAYAWSPSMTLSGNCVATFEHAAKFQTTLRTLCKFAVREKATGAITLLDIPQWPEAGSWTFASSGTIDLSAFAGKEVEIGFKYGSSAAGADTWEIKNLTVKKK